MKKQLSILFFLFSAFSIFAQNSMSTDNNGDKGITGFYEITFGTNKEDVIKIMKEKKWSIYNY